MADKRLFFALWPDERQRSAIRDQLQPLLSSVEGNAVGRGNWHVTLVFVGAFPEEHLDQLLIKAKHIECEPFRLRMDKVTFWPRPKIACLQALTVPDELKQLKGRLETMLAAFDVEPEQTEYRPHLTAVRGSRPFEPMRLARPIELQWSSFELIESTPGVGGPTYRPLKQEVL
ncbi:MAG: RNA 2',3'-cyclic phosphodiesterase [Gammaproteobacteria bacterium]